MTMLYYKVVNLPANPLTDTGLVKLSQLREKTTTYKFEPSDFRKLLNPDLVAALTELQLDIHYVVVFGSQDLDSFTTFIHTDIEETTDGTCHLVPCAINWELAPADVSFSWYDTKDSTPILSRAPNDDKTHGQHFITKNNKDASTFDLLETYRPRFQTPALVRTDIAHQVTYIPNTIPRISLSLRFSVAQISTWQQALEIFEHL